MEITRWLMTSAAPGVNPALHINSNGNEKTGVPHSRAALTNLRDDWEAVPQTNNFR
jgi:hypothetical protein